MEKVQSRSNDLIARIDQLRPAFSTYPTFTQVDVDCLSLLNQILNDWRNRASRMAGALQVYLDICREQSAEFNGEVPMLDDSYDLVLSFLAKFESNQDLGGSGEAFIHDKVTAFLASDTEFTRLIDDADRVMFGRNGIETLFSYFYGGPGAHRPAQAPPKLYIYRLETILDRRHPPPALEAYFDPKEIPKWIDSCVRLHGEHCSLPEGVPGLRYRPRWLIDVDRLCIVAAEHKDYYAFSYTWGSDRTFKVNQKNMAGLQKDNMLGMPLQELPIAFRHVITLCQRIKQRYLWIDVLCIISDDKPDQEAHLHNMHSIYANATATIIAAGAPVLYGLRGIKGATQPMERSPQKPGYLEKWNSRGYATTLQRDISSHTKRIESTFWAKRAWTYQEHLFSRRRIILTNETLSWECHCAIWFENMRALDDIPCRNKKQSVAQMTRDPAVDDLATHVATYNLRSLTYPEDALDAFKGVLTSLSPVFEGGFIHGLPVKYFDAAILWFNEAGLQRRTPRRLETKQDLLPSWSWPAWEGKISFLEFASTNAILKPIVDWSYRADSAGTWGMVVDSRSNDEARLDEESLFLTSFNNALFTRPMRAHFRATEVFDGLQILLDDGAGMLTSSTHIYDEARAKQETYEVVAISELNMGDETAYNVLWIGWYADTITAFRRGVGRILKSAWPADGDTKRVDLFLA